MCGTCGGSSSGGCGSKIGPIVINPIVSSSDAAGKYSVETKVNKSLAGGSAENIYEGAVPDTGTSADKTLEFYQDMVPIISDIVRSLVSDSYADPVTPFTPADAATLSAFQAYFTPTPALTAAQQAKLDHITANWYQLFKAGGLHAGADAPDASGTDVCASAGGRLFLSEISTCLFAVRLIMA